MRNNSAISILKPRHSFNVIGIIPRSASRLISLGNWAAASGDLGQGAVWHTQTTSWAIYQPRKPCLYLMELDLRVRSVSGADKEPFPAFCVAAQCPLLHLSWSASTVAADIVLVSLCRPHVTHTASYRHPASGKHLVSGNVEDRWPSSREQRLSNLRGQAGICQSSFEGPKGQGFASRSYGRSQTTYAIFRADSSCGLGTVSLITMALITEL